MTLGINSVANVTMNILCNVTSHLTSNLCTLKFGHSSLWRVYDPWFATSNCNSALKTSLSHTKTAPAVSKWTKHTQDFLFTPGNPKPWWNSPSVQHFAREGKICIWIRFAFLLHITFSFPGLVFSPRCYQTLLTFFWSALYRPMDAWTSRWNHKTHELN